MEMQVDIPEQQPMEIDAVRMETDMASVHNNADQKRIATHSHIRGLGLNADGTALPIEGGFVGQTAAREAAGIIVDMVRSRKMAGRGVLVAGAPGTGKTAIALAMAQELGPRVPFRPIVGSEVFSAEVKKTEVLTENMRRAIGLRVKEIKEVFEGEIVDLTPQEKEDVISGGKVITSVGITLRCSKGSKTIKMEPSVYESLMKAKIRVGDVVYIEANSGSVKRLGRADTYKNEFDLEADEFVPLPKGEVQKKREVIQDVTLHELDSANARPSSSSDSSSAMLASILRGPRSKTEITDKLRREINQLVNNYIEQGIAELIPGVLFIDEAHILDLECFTFLNRAIESPLAPLIVLATNRGVCSVRGTPDLKAPHGIPREFLDRLLIIRTCGYSKEEALKIIHLRARAEGLQVEDDAAEELAKLAIDASLRYAVQLLAPSSINASSSGRMEISLADVQLTSTLFIDTKRSAKLLVEM